MSQNINQPQRRSGSVSRAMRVLLALAALTAAGLSLGACTCQNADGQETACPLDDLMQQ